MERRKNFVKALQTSKMMIEDYIFKCSNRISPSNFTRLGKMGFKETLLFTLNMVKKSLQLEISNFFKEILKKDGSISKQAVLENRLKINPHAFVELNDAIIKVIYDKDGEFKLWNGYRLSAIDGSAIEIPDTESAKEKFGYCRNQNAKTTAKAKASCLYDIENKIILKSKIYRYDISEKEVVPELVSELVKDTCFNELILFDRGYPSYNLIAQLSELNIKFVMRRSKNTFIKRYDPQKEDQIIQIKYKKKKYEIRVVKFSLGPDNDEILLTNLFDKSYTLENFKELYFKRWGIEIKYNDLKSKLKIENFTGSNEILIAQDFYASIYLSNMVELAREDSDEIIKKDTQGKELKYEYKTNLNMLIGNLKDKLMLLFIEENPRKRNRLYKEIIDEVSKRRIPIRPGRQYARIEKSRRNKYSLNRKDCL